jgi:hypothetical protein
MSRRRRDRVTLQRERIGEPGLRDEPEPATTDGIGDHAADRESARVGPAWKTPVRPTAKDDRVGTKI